MPDRLNLIRALIIDDETSSCDLLQNLLQRYCSDVVVIGVAHSANDALDLIHSTMPDLVFLDINMPHGDGFSLLNQLDDIKFKIIFTTAFSEYAIQAFRISALDYLLKPLEIKLLQEAVEKFRKNGVPSNQTRQLDIFNVNKPKTIALSGMDEITFVNMDDIVRLEADGNYTIFFLADGGKVTVSNTLKTYEDSLSNYAFMRVHNSHIINMNKVKKYLKGKGGVAIMTDGSYINISPRRKDEFLKFCTST